MSYTLTRTRVTKRGRSLLALAALFAAGFAWGAEKAADVVSVQGQAQSRADEQAAWHAAVANQPVFASNYVRTLAYSRMGLLFVDRTQVRLAENTVMQIKPVPGRTVLRLEQGRSWSQTNASPADLRVETPSATAAIRGTDWEIEVQPDGASLLTVFSGEVAFYNQLGSVSVAAGEQAQALPGRAPAKIVLANPRDRVQWVTAYSIDPARHLDANAPPALQRVVELVRNHRVGDAFAAVLAEIESGAAPVAAYLIASDVMVYQGRIDRARDFVLQGLTRHRDDSRLVAQQVRIDIAAGDFARAQAELAPALATPRPQFEVRLAAGELARAEGDGEAARREYGAARDERPADDRPWYGLGVVDSEREAVASARANLQAAIARNPDAPGYLGELGTLHTFAHELRAAEAAFDAALQANPSDYVALTGRGVMLLKRGEPQAALESFLRASLLEPRYARAQVFAAVAQYQLGRAKEALARLSRASELDDKDPLPHLLASIIHTDLFEPAAAIEEAQRAMALLPYLKSLNQVANDRQGSANLGRAFSFFGLEQWAQSRAQESYYPYWGGSHLFLADRYPGDFNKNSELLQGFVTDPLAFGGSNRFQTLVTRPGHYVQGLLGYSYGTDVRLTYPVLRANGLFDAGVPVSYLVDVDRPWFTFTGGADGITGPDHGRAITAALGTRPVHELGLFAYGFDDRSDSSIASGPDGTLGLQSTQSTRSGNAGLSYRFGPQSQLWLRATAFRNEIATAGNIDTSLIDSRLVSRQPEYSLRHTFDAGAHQVTWGYESAHRSASNDYTFLDAAFPSFDTTALAFDELSRAAFVSDRWEPTPALLLEGDLRWADNRRTARSDTVLVSPLFGTVPISTAEDRSLRRIVPRAGVRYRITGAALLRVAYQDWIRPIALASMAPVATAGIPVDDRVTSRGGRLRRARAQFEVEANPTSYWNVYLDLKRIDNFLFTQKPFFIEEDDKIRRLRNFDYGRLTANDLYEFVSTPEFEGARIGIAGGAVNAMLTRTLSAAVQYEYTDSHNTSADPTRRDRPVPYHARHAAALTMTWITPLRFYLSARGVYRTERFKDEYALERLAPGWDGEADLFWESADKRVRVRLGIDNAFRAQRPEQYSATLVLNF